MKRLISLFFLINGLLLCNQVLAYTSPECYFNAKGDVKTVCQEVCKNVDRYLIARCESFCSQNPEKMFINCIKQGCSIGVDIDVSDNPVIHYREYKKCHPDYKEKTAPATKPGNDLF